MRRTTLLAAGLATAAILAPATASASPACFGTTGTEVVCVDPLGQTVYSDCVYLGSGPCRPVHVPGPTASCEGVFDCDLIAFCLVAVDICVL